MAVTYFKVKSQHRVERLRKTGETSDYSALEQRNEVETRGIRSGDVIQWTVSLRTSFRVSAHWTAVCWRAFLYLFYTSQALCGVLRVTSRSVPLWSLSVENRWAAWLISQDVLGHLHITPTACTNCAMERSVVNITASSVTMAAWVQCLPLWSPGVSPAAQTTLTSL